MDKEGIKFDYEISFRDGRIKNFHLELDPDSLALIFRKPQAYPDWTQLTCCQCPNCPLSPKESPYCPVAVNLLPVTDAFSKDISHEEVNVVIKTKPRNYQRNISLQDALRSLFGIYMATSGCPVMDKLRPLVLTHFPFATIEETAYRALSMYVLAQYFIQKRGGHPNWDLKNLGKIYQEVEIVNQAFHKRLVSAGFEDASLNAIGNLNCYALFTQMCLAPEKLKKIENLFSAYFTD